MFEEITNIIAEYKLNIEGFANKGRNDITYKILDFQVQFQTKQKLKKYQI